MKLFEIINETYVKSSENEEVMTAAEIESTLDDIETEFGDDPKVKKCIKTVSNYLLKNDMVKATKEMEKLMDYIRNLTD